MKDPRREIEADLDFLEDAAHLISERARGASGDWADDTVGVTKPLPTKAPHLPPKRTQVPMAKRSNAKAPAGKAKQAHPKQRQGPRPAVSNIKGVTSGTPRVTGSKYSKDGSITVTYREYLVDVQGSPEFSAFPVPLNPGMPQYTWLHRIASEFEFYRFEHFALTYATDTSTAVGGSVIMAVDYDSLDVAPASKSEMMMFTNAVRNATWQNFTYTASKALLNASAPHRYVRAGAPPAASDLKTYDAGVVWVATQGQTDVNIGEVYVEYTVKFIGPHINLHSIARNQVMTAFVDAAGGQTLAVPMGQQSGWTNPGGMSGGTLPFLYGDSVTTPALSPGGSYASPCAAGYYYVIWAVYGVSLVFDPNPITCISAGFAPSITETEDAQIIDWEYLTSSAAACIAHAYVRVKREPKNIADLKEYFAFHGPSAGTLSSGHLTFTQGAL